MNIEEARTNMIKQQIRACGVVNDRIIEILVNTPREHFVPEQFQNLAFADTNIIIGHEQTMMTPFEEAYMLQALNPKATDNVLEIGTGSAYITALLARLAKKVYSIDTISDFTKNAKQKLKELNISNVTLITDDALEGWDKKAPYDVIAITASMPTLPEKFKTGLSEGGRLFIVLGNSPAMEATLITRVSEDKWTKKVIFETVVPRLQGAEEKESFNF